MTDTEMTKVVDAWIASSESEKVDTNSENWWATSLVMDWHFEGEDEFLWNFILSAYQRDMSERAFAGLAAGPLEDLLADNGEKYIDRIETLARRDPKFNYLLGGVWKSSITKGVWDRVEKARLQAW